MYIRDAMFLGYTREDVSAGGRLLEAEFDVVGIR